MGATTHSIEVNAPLQVVYNQWTQFEEFPRFMEGVEEVRHHGPNRLFWKANIGGKEKQWEAEITEEVPNKKIAWRSVDGTPNVGAVTFEALDAMQTRITLTMEYEPEGFFEKAGDALGIPSSQIEGDLNRFREFMENGENGAGAWSGQIEPLEGFRSAEPALIEGDAVSVEESTDRKALFQDRSMPPANVATGAIASDEGEASRKGEHGIVIADTPRAKAVEGSSVEENSEIDRNRLGPAAAPTHEQIARRAHELYLERGKKPGDEREDWLTAEKELSEKNGDNGSA